MGADGHAGLRELLGSYALGALEPDEAARVRAHLEGCPECKALADELAPVAAALPAADLSELAFAVAEAGTVGPLLARIASERRALRRRRQRRIVGAGAAAVAAAAAIAVAVPFGGGGGGEAPSAPGVEVERDLRSLRAGVSGSVALADRFWGSQLTLRAEGLPARRRVFVWLERRDGRRVAAGTIYGLGGRPLRAELAAGLRVRDAVAVGVSDAGGRDLLAASTRE